MTERIALEPNLFIPGAAKSGTSTLHELLDQHPEIAMSRPKEPHILSRRERRANSSHEYGKLWAPEAANVKYRGESTTGYLPCAEALDCIGSKFPEARVIVVLRNPIDRIISHHRWLVGLGYEYRPLQKAVAADMNRPYEPENRIAPGYQYYFHHSRYALQIKHLYGAVAREQVMITTFEALRADERAYCSQVFKFLGVDDSFEVAPLHANASKPAAVSSLKARANLIHSHARFQWPRDPGVPVRVSRVVGGLAKRFGAIAGRFGQPVKFEYTAADRRWLAELLRPEVEPLAAMTGQHFDVWSEDFPALA